MVEQGSPEWMAMRAGNFTASRMADLMARTKTGPSASRKNMITTLAVERLTGQCVETYTNAAMERGKALEQEALDAYAFERGVAVEPVAYVEHATLPRTGCSPDGLVNHDGLVEVKCPAAMAKHMEALTSAAHAEEYRWQLQHQLLVTGREWVDAVSYDPRWPSGLQLAIKRVFRNAEDIEALTAEIAKADAEIETLVRSLRSLAARDEEVDAMVTRSYA